MEDFLCPLLPDNHGFILDSIALVPGSCQHKSALPLLSLSIIKQAAGGKGQKEEIEMSVMT